MPRVLFVHNGSPGRFAFLARALLARGWTGVLINDDKGRDLPGMPVIRWSSNPPPLPGLSSAMAGIRTQLLAGEGAMRAAARLKENGFQPDLIIGHPGWGEMLFLDEIYRGVPQIQLGEYYYHSHDSDVDFDPEFPHGSIDDVIHTQSKNLPLAASYAKAEHIVVPTGYQASTIPAVFGSRIALIHEGVDTAHTRAREDPTLGVTLPDGIRLGRGHRVVTFVNRRLEPLRGFHAFMRALPTLLAGDPTVQVVIVGAEDGRGYGLAPPPGKTWKDVMLAELDGRIDRDRVHFTGIVPYEMLLDLFSIASAHVYMTYPFVLSWSLLNAMACGCLVIGSDTAPVREVISHGENGLLFDFFDGEALTRTLLEVCAHPERYTALRAAARETVVSRYDRETVCKPAWLTLIDRVMAIHSLKASAEG